MELVESLATRRARRNSQEPDGACPLSSMSSWCQVQQLRRCAKQCLARLSARWSWPGGVRTGRSAADVIERCFTVLARRKSAEWILEGDIASCFDRISHEWLLNHVPMEQSILHKWLQPGFMSKSVFYPTESGTPQGGVASPMLANLALDGLQKPLQDRFPKRQRINRKVNMVRYADDFIVTGDSKQLLEDEVMPLVERFLGERGLEPWRRKTVVTQIDTGFDFVGQTVRKYRGKLLITPLQATDPFISGLGRERIKMNKTASAVRPGADAQPRPAGLGELPPARGQQEHLQARGPSNLEGIVAIGSATAPQQGPANGFGRSTSRGRLWILTARSGLPEEKSGGCGLFSVASVPIQRHVLVHTVGAGVLYVRRNLI